MLNEALLRTQEERSVAFAWTCWEERTQNLHMLRWSWLQPLDMHWDCE
jgi:hypothetical protein